VVVVVYGSTSGVVVSVVVSLSVVSSVIGSSFWAPP
jgi:hypothetical protein